MGDPVGCDIAVLVQIQVQDTGLGSISRNELRTKSSNKFIRIFDKTDRECIYSEIDGSQTFDSRIISEDTDISSRS